MSSVTEQVNKFESLVQHLPANWQELAVEKRAFLRSRQIKSPLDLLRLIFTYLVADFSLRQTAAALISRRIWMTDQAVHHRLRNCRDWLETLLMKMINQELSLSTDSSCASIEGLKRLKIVDASVLNCPGAKAVDYLLHLCFDLVEQTISAVKITDGRTAEGFKNFEFSAGDIILADRVYAKAEQIIKVAEQGAQVIVRVSLQQIKFFEENGKLFDWKQLLARATPNEKFSQCVFLKDKSGNQQKVWLHGQRLDERGREKGRRKIRLQAIKTGCQTREATIWLSEWIVVLTTLSSEELNAEQALSLYRLRWQIEIYFKRLKMLLKLGHQRGQCDSALAEADIFGRLLLALLLAAESGRRLWSRWDSLKWQRKTTSFGIWKLMLEELREALLETRNWSVLEWCRKLRIMRPRKRKRKLQSVSKEVLNKLKQPSKLAIISNMNVEINLAA
jgi:hypothetical protein